MDKKSVITIIAVIVSIIVVGVVGFVLFKVFTAPKALVDTYVDECVEVLNNYKSMKITKTEAKNKIEAIGKRVDLDKSQLEKELKDSYASMFSIDISLISYALNNELTTTEINKHIEDLGKYKQAFYKK